MSSAPMNAVKERKQCSLARREAGTESRMVEDIGLREKQRGLGPRQRVNMRASFLRRGAEQLNLLKPSSAEQSGPPNFA